MMTFHRTGICLSTVVLGLEFLFGFDSRAATWALGVTGDDRTTYQAHFQTGVIDFSDAMSALGINSSQTSVLFGSRGRQYYFDHSAAQDQRVEQAEAAFLSAKDCSPMNSLVNLYLEPGDLLVGNREFGHTVNSDMIEKARSGTEASDLTDDVTTRVILEDQQKAEKASQLFTDKDSLSSKISGDSSNKNIEEFLKRMKKGDHVFIEINGHGLHINTPDFNGLTVALGTAKEKISAEHLATLVKTLADEGVKVHLSVNACYSGGFNQTISEISSIPSGAVCTTASVNANTISMIASGKTDTPTFDTVFNQNLATYHNQLQAFACSLAIDNWNNPESTLDLIVRGQPLDAPQVEARPPCNQNNNSAPAPESIITDTLSEVNKQQLRQDIIASFNNDFVRTLEGCKLRAGGPSLRSRMAQCLDQVQGNKEFKKDIGDLLKQEAGDDYRKHLVANHLHFLQNADGDKIRRYRDAYCCLRYDLKTGAMPDFCK